MKRLSIIAIAVSVLFAFNLSVFAAYEHENDSAKTVVVFENEHERDEFVHSDRYDMIPGAALQMGYDVHECLSGW